MKKLFHVAKKSSSTIKDIKKIVFNIQDYKLDESILFTNETNFENQEINYILTTSSKVYNTLHKIKQVLYFESIEEIEENAIVKIDFNTLYFTFRPSSNDHTLFLTSKCNHYCLMCSEPPKLEDEPDLVLDTLKIIDLIDTNLNVIGISGGEPTLLGNDFIKILKKIREKLPKTIIRVLTNGRAFHNENFTKQVSLISNGYLVLEIPLYHSYYAKHDYIVQSKNAFFETIEGFYRCAQYNISTEVRIVISKQNYNDLSNLIYFIYRNIPFVDHIALMGLEYIGFAINNFKEIHISPLEYQSNLYQAVLDCYNYSLPISIYNLPLCLLHNQIKNYAKQSISDWKNEYSEICSNCIDKNNCSGMFSSTKKYFEPYLKPNIS